MGGLVVLIALVLPIAFHVFGRSRLADRVTDRLTREVGEDAAPVVYVGAWFVAVIAMFWAAGVTGAGVSALLAFAFSGLVVGMIRFLSGESVETD